MVEYLIILISLIIGIIIGWALKNRSQPADNMELQSIINKLTDEKARAEAKLQQLDEIKMGMGAVFKSLASDIAKENREDFLNIAGEKFKDISKQADDNLTKKKELIDRSINTVSFSFSKTTLEDPSFFCTLLLDFHLRVFQNSCTIFSFTGSCRVSFCFRKSGRRKD